MDMGSANRRPLLASSLSGSQESACLGWRAFPPPGRVSSVAEVRKTLLSIVTSGAACWCASSRPISTPPPHAETTNRVHSFRCCQGVVQRSYNAYAVRVQDTNPSNHPQTPGGGLGLGGLTHGLDKGRGTLKVIPANQTTEGILCIEMRIRLYHDGAMSKILEKLAKVCLLFVWGWKSRVWCRFHVASLLV